MTLFFFFSISGTYSLEQDICDQIPTINDCPRTSKIGLDKCRSRQTEKRKHSIDVNDCERLSKRKCRDVSFSKNGRHFGLEIPRCSTDVCIPGLFSPPAQNYGFNMNTGKGRTIPRESQGKHSTLQQGCQLWLLLHVLNHIRIPSPKCLSCFSLKITIHTMELYIWDLQCYI